MNGPKQEKEMRAAFREQTGRILAFPERFEKSGQSCRIGFESEIAIHADELALADLERTRNAIIGEMPGAADVELGAAQIELRTNPFDILAAGVFGEIAAEYRKNFQLAAAAAKKHGCSLLRVGANPFLPVKNTPRTNTPKYRLVPDFYNRHRPKEADTIIGLGKHRIDIGDAAVVSLFQSFQVNLEACSFADALDKMNRTLMLAPYLLAMSANARYLEFLDTRIQDTRLLAWQLSHDTRVQDLRLLSWEKAFEVRTAEEKAAGRALRVGLPERYFADMADYLKRAGEFPFILHRPEAALGIAIGMTWLDARVKFIGDSLVVELRLLPTQPTLEEELLLALLYIGRLIDSQTRREVLLPLYYVRENRLSAMLHGSRPSLWFLSDEGKPLRLPCKTGLKEEIARAKRGLSSLGLLNLLDAELLKSVIKNGPPSERLAKSLRKLGGLASEQMKQALRETQMLV